MVEGETLPGGRVQKVEMGRLGVQDVRWVSGKKDFLNSLMLDMGTL